MKKKTLFRKLSNVMAAAVLAGALALSGCTNAGSQSVENGQDGTQIQISSTEETTGSGTTQTALSAVSSLDVSDMFSNRDQKTEYEESECVVITLNGDSAACESSDVSIEGSTITIQKAGSYILRGSLKNGTIKVEAGQEDKVQLILDGAEISATGTACIYAKEADKVFITLAEGSTNQITNTGDFVSDDENNIDGAIFSKCDLTLNGKGSLTVSSEKGHGIVSKDDLKITGGTYEITAGDHGISGKDSIRIADGTINITSVQDGLHSGNDEDAAKGYVYIAGGEITITADDDGIHGESKVVIAGGTVNIAKSYEGMEAAIVEIAGGDITVNASDDGINATDGSGSEGFGLGRMGDSTASSEVYILISGGRLVVNAKGDGLDSNGNLYVKGGVTYVSGPENSGNGALDYERSGEITGGSLIAVGSTGMAMNFSSATQGSALITTSSMHNAGELIQLTDSKGNILLQYTPTSKFASVVVSTTDMKQGETYTLIIGSEKQEFTLTDLIYGKSTGFGGGMGGFGGGMGGGRRGNMDGSQNGQDGSQGNFDGNFRGRPGMQENSDGSSEGMPEMPEGFDGSFEGMPEMPEGFDGSFEGMPEMPEGFDGNFQGGSGMQDRNGGKMQGGKGGMDRQGIKGQR